MTTPPSQPSQPSPSRPPRRFHVYVVELDHRALDSSQPCVYVGETGLTPSERYARHRAGGRTAARVVHRHGVRLRPDLCASWGPYPSRASAVVAEADLAAALRAAGYGVFGGQGHTFTLNHAAPRAHSDTAGVATAMPPRARVSREEPHDAHL